MHHAREDVLWSPDFMFLYFARSPNIDAAEFKNWERLFVHDSHQINRTTELLDVGADTQGYRRYEGDECRVKLRQATSRELSHDSSSSFLRCNPQQAGDDCIGVATKLSAMARRGRSIGAMNLWSFHPATVSQTRARSAAAVEPALFL